MRNTRSSPPTALSNAVTAWNSKARAISEPALRHVVSAIASLRQLESAIRQVGLADDAPESPDALEMLDARLKRLQEFMARLDDEAGAAAREGESLFQALSAEVPHDALVEIDGQSTPGSTTAGNPTPQSGQAKGARSVSQIELQSVQEFVQNSPLASIPINASYYERILEAANSPEGHKVPMGKILTAAGVVTEHQLQYALDHQHKGQRRALGTALVELGYTTEDAIAQALAAQLALPYIELTSEPIHASAVSAIPVRMARRHACIPLNYTGHALCVAMANPLDLIALEDLRIAARNHIRPCVATRSDIVRHIERYYV